MKKDDTKNNTPANEKRSTSELFEKAKKRVISAIDQNDDGRLNLKDITSVSERLSEKREQMKREAEYNLLRPLFEDDLDRPDFVMPKMIRVIPMDKKHAESELCTGSIGHESVLKDLTVINIYPESLSFFGLSFYPDVYSDVYYVNPSDRDHYIALDDYFNYLRVARVSELQRIAQDLGAKHFRVTYKEQAASSNSGTLSAKTKIGLGKKSVGADAEHESNERNFQRVEIAAEMQCIGHKPVKPELVYFKKDPQIQSLISLRMADNAMTHQIYTLDLSNSSGIKVKDAVKIDASLSALKANTNISVAKEAQSEAHRFFEYEIDF